MRRVRELEPIRRQSKSEEVAKEFAALVAQSVVAKFPKPELSARTGPKRLTRGAALPWMLVVTLFAMAARYQLGSMTCGLN